jgi:uncharacterized SAM-binding protein YcdF (DUF218 family)
VTTMRFWLRFFLISAALWAGGFFWFDTQLPPNTPTAVSNIKTDGIVVLTGGDGRVERGLESLKAGNAKRLLISGAYRETTAAQIAARTATSLKLFNCCVDIGYDAGNTIGNAGEAAAWVRKNKYESVRIVTSRYHVPRSLLEFEARLKSTRFVVDAVPDSATRLELVREYNKFLFRLLWLRVVEPVVGLIP